jgi:hypothetical protein
MRPVGSSMNGGAFLLVVDKRQRGTIGELVDEERGRRCARRSERSRRSPFRSARNVRYKFPRWPFAERL